MVAKVYGRIAPRSDERDRWERIAALPDQAEAPIGASSTPMGTVAGTRPDDAENDKARNPLGSRALSSSRGGTRTRDPGIMSAVL
jgi:hypothetical protein